MLEEMLTYENVHLGVELPEYTKEAGLKSVSALCANDEVSEAQLLDAFTKREAEYSTGCGGGIAIPHAKIPGLKNPQVVVVRFAEPIDWEAIDGKPITMCICMVMPNETKDNIHLKVISQLSRKLINKKFVSHILSEEDPKALRDYMVETVGA